MTEELITLMSLDDVAQANVIKTKLETEGIACFMNNCTKSISAKRTRNRIIDLRVYMRDLDKALQLISDEIKEGKTE